MKITAKPCSYFFTDSIYLNPGQSITLSPSGMSDLELEDVLQGFTLGTLEVDDIGAVRDEYALRQQKGGSSTGGAVPNIELERLSRTVTRNSDALANLAQVSVPNFKSTFIRNLV